MKTVLQDMNNPHAGGTSSTRLLNLTIPEHYKVQPTDDNKVRRHKYKLYKKWCDARGIEPVLLEGMLPLRTKPSADDPIPANYYIQPTDTQRQKSYKYYAYKDWCRVRGIEFHPLPDMVEPRHKKSSHCERQTAAELAQERRLTYKPRYHENCTTYIDAEFRLDELVVMRDNCHDNAKWQELQSQINALRVKLQSWQNEKADRKYTMSTAYVSY